MACACAFLDLQVLTLLSLVNIMGSNEEATAGELLEAFDITKRGADHVSESCVFFLFGSEFRFYYCFFIAVKNMRACLFYSTFSSGLLLGNWL